MKPIGSKLYTAGLLAAALLGMQAHANAQEPVLKNSQVTESALIDALEVEGPAVPASGVTRGFRPAVRPAGAKPAGPGKASLLITFATASAELLPESKTALDTVAKALQSDKLAGFTFKVEGHADPRGLAEQNMTLSQQRAQAVVNYLVKERGILPERLAPQGKGATELADPQRPDAPENRRVTIVTDRP
jgi:outer membrane protein OmpA-like peptidoglycan-associated protein